MNELYLDRAFLPVSLIGSAAASWSLEHPSLSGIEDKAVFFLVFACTGWFFHRYTKYKWRWLGIVTICFLFLSDTSLLFFMERFIGSTGVGLIVGGGWYLYRHKSSLAARTAGGGLIILFVLGSIGGHYTAANGVWDSSDLEQGILLVFSLIWAVIIEKIVSHRRSSAVGP